MSDCGKSQILVLETFKGVECFEKHKPNTLWEYLIASPSNFVVKESHLNQHNCILHSKKRARAHLKEAKYRIKRLRHRSKSSSLLIDSRPKRVAFILLLLCVFTHENVEQLMLNTFGIASLVTAVQTLLDDP